MNLFHCYSANELILHVIVVMNDNICVNDDAYNIEDVDDVDDDDDDDDEDEDNNDIDVTNSSSNSNSYTNKTGFE